ncbi:MAG: uroporphyrinogen decarboxylase family protein [Planctomycetota bacterium]
MKPRDFVLEQIHHRETRPVPYTLGIEGEVAEGLDEHYGGPSWRERLVPYIVGVGAVNTDPREELPDGRTRDAYGAVWRTDLRPEHLETPPLAKPSFEGYDFPAPERFLGSPEGKERSRKACEEKGDSFLLAGLGWGLFELSWKLRGFENALVDAVAEPDFYEEMLDRLTELYLAFVDYSADLPVDAMMFGDDWGDQRGVILGPERWRKFIKPRWAKIYQAVHDCGKLTISHCCGSVEAIMPDIIEIGLDVLESVQPEAADMNPYELKKKWGDKITFWGCLGTQSTTHFGTPEGIRAEVGRLCREMGACGGYILSPAKPLQPGTPVENAAAALEAFTDQG